MLLMCRLTNIWVKMMNRKLDVVFCFRYYQMWILIAFRMVVLKSISLCLVPKKLVLLWKPGYRYSEIYQIVLSNVWIWSLTNIIPSKVFHYIIYYNLSFKEKIQNKSSIADELEKESLFKILTFINIVKVIIPSVAFW